MSEITLTVGPAHTLREAAAKMVEKGTGAALVLDGELPTPSIVTERDLLISIARGQDPDRERVVDHMSEGVLTAAPDWSLERAAAEMSRRGVRHLVVFEAAEPVGVLSIRDIVRCWTSDGATSEMTLPGR
jgi:signal-transduction protein with cAMP-binding, CBS, and nucleotidyltransferase domain